MKNEYLKPHTGIAMLIVLLLAYLPGAVHADKLIHYRITIDNLTEQPFSPKIAVTHDADLGMYRKDGPVSAEPSAENGNQQSSMFDHLYNDRQVTDVIGIGVPIAAKEATTFGITARPGNRLSLASMEVCTNKGFTGLNRARLPQRGAEIVWTASNTELSTDFAEPCNAFAPTSLPGGHNRHQDPAAKITITRVSDDANKFLARLSGAGEVPPIQATDDAWGQADLMLNADNTELIYRLKALRIKSGVIQVRIHQGLPNDNGPVVAHLFEPSNPTLDEHLNASGNLTQSELIGPLAGDFKGFVDALRAGELYINVNSNAYPLGEIRGQVGVK